MSDLAFDYLSRAEDTLLQYAGAGLVTDEAELLRGCLHALVAIARLQYEAHGPEEEPAQPAARNAAPCGCVPRCGHGEGGEVCADPESSS